MRNYSMTEYKTTGSSPMKETEDCSCTECREERKMPVTQEEINKYLTLAMGECHHEWAEQWHDAGSDYTYFECIKCGIDYHIADIDIKCGIKKLPQTDFFSEIDFFKLWRWSQKQDWFGEFGEAWTNKYFWDEIVDPDRFATAVYEFLKAREK